MGMNFQFATAGEIIFGAGSLKQIPEKTGKNSHSVCLVTGQRPGASSSLIEALESLGKKILSIPVSGEPTLDSVDEAVKMARRFRADLVIGIGGGSVLDTGKIISALLTNEGQVIDYLEVIGSGKSIRTKPVPYIAVPTTSGPGTEVTRNAVVCSPGHQVKVSMRHTWMIPSMAVIDPLLMHSMPPEITACAGLDALSQLIEPFVSKGRNPFSDSFCREGLDRAANSLKRAFVHGQDAEAREDMAVASLFGGLALANAKLGAVHGMAAPAGGMSGAPHGIICARLLAPVLRMNFNALESRFPGSPLIPRFHEMGRLLSGSPDADAYDAVRYIEELCVFFRIPPLSEFGIREQDYSRLIEKSKQSGSMKGNPVDLNDEELKVILDQAVFGTF